MKKDDSETKTANKDGKADLARTTSVGCTAIVRDSESHAASATTATDSLEDVEVKTLIQSVPPEKILKQEESETRSGKEMDGPDPSDSPTEAIEGLSIKSTPAAAEGPTPGDFVQEAVEDPGQGASEEPATVPSAPISPPAGVTTDVLLNKDTMQEMTFRSERGKGSPVSQSSVADATTEPIAASTLSQGPVDFHQENIPSPLPLARNQGLRGSNTNVGAHAIYGPAGRDEEIQDGTITSNTVRPTQEENSIAVSEVDLNSPAAFPSSAASASASVSNFSDFSDLIEATLVEDWGEEVVEAKPVENKKIKRTRILTLVLVAVVAIVAAIAFSLWNGGSNDSGAASNTTGVPELFSSPTPAPLPTLQRIRNDGVLRCGVVLENVTNNIALEKGKENTFEAQICRALGAAAMGRDSYQIELVSMALPDRVQMLESGTIDVLLAGLSWTMDRDVYVPGYERGLGLGFAAVYTFLTSNFGGDPQYLGCTQNGMKYIGECADMMLCMLNGTRYYDTLSNQLPRGQLKLVPTSYDSISSYLKGECNVFAASSIAMTFMSRVPGVTFEIAQGYYSSEPLSIVTHKDDRQWMDFCNYVMLALLAAEYHNITSENVDFINGEGNNSSHPKFQRPTGFGGQYKDMFIDAVATVGNFGEMEARTVKPLLLPRDPINHVNNGTTGAIYSIPFGNDRVAGPSLDERFQDIFSREKLRCAIRTGGRPGFAQRIGNTTASYSGMDVDYCLAIAASIFNTPLNTVAFFEVQDDSAGFDLLQRGEVDVLAGVARTMERDVKEPGTGVGFSFTAPYFYNSSADGTQSDPDANLCLATREDNSGWSEYVFWIVQATFYADEEGITRFRANEMPLVEFYGDRFTRALRDAISAVGSYGEIYFRNVEDHVPRQGMNLLHDKTNPTPLMYIPPGIFQ